MYRFWEPVIEPLLTRLEPRTLIEIGSDYGPNTHRLLEFCEKKRAVLHVIDPLPKYEVDTWLEQYPDQLVFHRAPSLTALPTVPAADTVLIDGDHNWHTVINELRLLAKRAAEDDKPFPLVLLHDVGWPYGRRDLYYDPERIPQSDRQPYEKAGLRPGRDEPDPDGGLNRHRFNATHEGGPRNGVLTAIEDFRSEADFDLDLVVVPGINDLGILAPSDLALRAPGVTEFVRTLRAPALTELLRVVETVRVERQIESLDQRGEIRRLERDASRRSLELGEASARADALAQQRAELEHQVVDLTATLKELRIDLEKMDQALKEARKANLALVAKTEDLQTREAENGMTMSHLRDRYQRLQSRRSVRVALFLARLASPLVRLGKGDAGPAPRVEQRAEEWPEIGETGPANPPSGR